MDSFDYIQKANLDRINNIYNSFEKGQYKNNPQNRKLGRVGNEYGGKKEEGEKSVGKNKIYEENLKDKISDLETKRKKIVALRLEELKKIGLNAETGKDWKHEEYDPIIIELNKELKDSYRKLMSHYSETGQSPSLEDKNKMKTEMHKMELRYDYLVDNLKSAEGEKEKHSKMSAEMKELERKHEPMRKLVYDVKEKFKPFKLGDKWSNNFDYDGMLEVGSKATLEMGLDKLEKLYSSYEDVNYHRENSYLGEAISSLKEGKIVQAAQHLKRFNAESKNA